VNVRLALLMASAALITASALTQVVGQVSMEPMAWHMVDVNDTDLQGDAHLLLTPHRKSVLIDAGYYDSAERKLVPYLRERNIRSIDHVFVTHPHKDHYAGLVALIRAGVKLRNVYFNLPDKPTCDVEIPWGCDYQDILDVQAFIRASGANLSSVGENFRVHLGHRSHLTIVYAFDNTNTPVGPIDINDMSLIMRLQHEDNSVMFTGDLNALIGGYLADKGKNLHATMLKVPHHGTEGVAPNGFFDRVKPEISMVPSPLWLWCSARSERVRRWHQEQRVPTYVNGGHGHLVTTLGAEKPVVVAEHGEKSSDPQLLCDESLLAATPAAAPGH
jgi:beta-lactamase superfamily II metal-dependent hydrolase